MSSHDSAVIARLIGVTGFVDGMDDLEVQEEGKLVQITLLKSLARKGEG